MSWLNKLSLRATIILSLVFFLGAKSTLSSIAQTTSPQFCEPSSQDLTTSTIGSSEPQVVSPPDELSDQRQLASSVVSVPSSERLESLTKQIAKKETELIRLNTNFRIECTKVSKWKPWRLFLYNLGASGCSEAGITSITATRWHYWTKPKQMSRSTAMAGPILLLAGHSISLGGVLAEATLDIINDHKVKKKGFDLKTTHKRVLAIKSELDKLLIERDVLIQQLPAPDLELARAEGSVLKDVRDLSLNEYTQFFVRANKFFASRDTNTLMTIAAASTGGFQGSLLGIISASKKQPRLVGPGGIGFIISGAAVVATPLAARLMANLRGNHARRKIASELDNIAVKSVSQLDADRLKLEQMLSQLEHAAADNSPNMTRRLHAYAKQSAVFTAQNKMIIAEKTLADKEFKERALVAAAIGGTKIGWGINLANAGFRFHPRSVIQGTGNKAKLVASAAPAKLFTKRVATGATIYVPGTSLWILDTLQNRVRGEMRNHQLASQKGSPGSLLKERMDRVEEIDQAFNY